MDKHDHNPSNVAKAAAEASVLAVASNVSGGMAAARQWYFHEAIPEFDGLTASQAIAAGLSDDVMRYIKALEALAVGWADFDAGRFSEFDPEDIKSRGRERLDQERS